MAETMLQDRKKMEEELHDHLRGNLSNDLYYTSNKKFYSITQTNRDYVKAWLAERCMGRRVLDYCCGNGEFTMWLAATGADAYGIDISPISIENAKNQASTTGMEENIKFDVMDAEKTQFDDDYFDFAVVNGVLHHLDLEKAYRELARILKSEGEVICTEALRHNVFIHLYRKMTPHLRTTWEVEHILGKKEIEIARKYFNKVEVNKFFHLATIGAIPFRNSSVFEFIKRGLELVDKVLLRLPTLKWQAWMAVFILSHPKKPVGKT